MKIAQICPYDIDRPGGVQRHIRDTTEALAERGHQVTIIAPGTDTPPRPAPSGVAIHRLGRSFRIGIFGTTFEIALALGRQRAQLKALMRQFDVAHFHTVWSPFLALQALSFFDGPAVATFHDTPPETLSGRMLRALFRLISRRLLPRFDAILTPSEAPQRHLVSGPGQTLTIFPPCTDLRPFMNAEPQPGFRDGPLNILFLGRLEPRKGAMLLLKAFASLRAANPRLRLIIAGTGAEEKALRNHVETNRIPSVIFAGAPSDPPSWFATADIFCAPSPYGESFGIVIAEAMASGKPVVAAANAGYRTLLTGEAARFLVTPGEPQALAEALAVLAADDGLRHRLGEWGRTSAPRYDCRTLAPQLEAIFRDAIQAHRLKVQSAT
jgi:phosphatidylinositol alpha-mannosyltransferase